jgi:hypothetical protein
MYSLMMLMLQYKFFPKNTSYGDYGNATGPDGTFTGLLLKPESLMQDLQSCWLQDGCRYRKINTKLPLLILLQVLCTPKAMLTMEFKIIIWFINKQLKCGLLL